MENEEKLYKRVSAALAAFFREDRKLLHVDASERSISHKLAEQLQKQFPQLNVDCEYNRHINSVKRLTYRYDETIKPDDLEAKTVFPDIVVHKRQSDESNLLVIEIKKGDSGQRTSHDVEKLKAFTVEPYVYGIGLFLSFNVQRKRLADVRCFSNSTEEENTIWDKLKELGDGE